MDEPVRQKRHYNNVDARDYEVRLGEKPNSMEEYVNNFLHPLPKIGDMVVVYNNGVIESIKGEDSDVTGYYRLDKAFLDAWDEPRAYVVDDTKIFENVLDHRSYVRLRYKDDRRGINETRFVKTRDIVCGYTLLFKVNSWLHEDIARIPRKMVSGRSKRSRKNKQ